MIDSVFGMAPCGQHPATPLSIQVTAGGQPALCVQCVLYERDRLAADNARLRDQVAHLTALATVAREQRAALRAWDAIRGPDRHDEREPLWRRYLELGAQLDAALEAAGDG